GHAGLFPRRSATASVIDAGTPRQTDQARIHGAPPQPVDCYFVSAPGGAVDAPSYRYPPTAPERVGTGRVYRSAGESGLVDQASTRRLYPACRRVRMAKGRLLFRVA